MQQYHRYYASGRENNQRSDVQNCNDQTRRLSATWGATGTPRASHHYDIEGLKGREYHYAERSKSLGEPK